MTMRSSYILPVLSILFFTSACSNIAVLTDAYEPEFQQEINYTAIFYIHGDSDYLFHQSDGTPRQANERAFSNAISIAENAESGEFFIIHQLPQRKWMGIFPRRSSEVYHFRNGELIHQVKYRYEDKAEPFLATESALFKKHPPIRQATNHQTYFFFFGHEIPVFDGTNYHVTRPDIEVTEAALASGLRGFLQNDEEKFDLVTLSTCSNGTPGMAKNMKPASYYLLATPQNLHLSYLDVESLKLLETQPGITPPEIATEIANQTFNRLDESILTVITLALYDLREVGSYIDELAGKINEYEEKERPNRYRDNIDCAQLSFFDSESYSNGLKTWYRPAAFGNRTVEQKHSGWGCKGL